MPKTQIEILRTVTITRDESVEVEVNVPQDVLDDPDGLCDWTEQQLKRESSELFKAVHDTGWDVADEDESEEIQEVNDFG